LADQPLMRGVLADMALASAAATALVMRLCRSFDLAATDPREAARARLLTPAVKFWVCKRAPAFVYEAMECLGGNGYVEESLLPRLYREAPVNAIWEGSGNVMCLGVLVDHRRAFLAAHVGGDQLALDRGGRKPLVPERDRQLGPAREIAGEGAGRLRARPLAAIHVDRQAEHEADHFPLGRERQQA